MSKANEANLEEPEVHMRPVGTLDSFENQKTEFPAGGIQEEVAVKKPWGQRIVDDLKTPGHAFQIVVAAAIAIGIGIAVSVTVDDVPTAAPAILGIPGTLWLRGLKATVLPLIVVAIIIAMQNLRQMAREGAALARYTIMFYVGTTILAVIHSMIITDLGWRRLMRDVRDSLPEMSETAEEKVKAGDKQEPHDIVVTVFESFIPANIVSAVAEDELLAVLITAIIVGLLIKGPNSSLLRATKEVERIVSIAIAFLIKLAPLGVFSLILSNLLTLDVAAVGVNVGVLLGASIAQMLAHLFLVLPMIFFLITRTNPYSYWMKCSPAWITAWGTASSAATMPVTLRMMHARKVPDMVSRFSIPLGTLINMDGTAIYFPMVVVFLATTQGIKLNAGDYTIIVLLSTLSSIATTPIPSSSLVLTVMIANAVNVPVTGMFAIVVAFDWLIDRFRTMTNVSGDMYAAKCLEKLTGITDKDELDLNFEESRGSVGHPENYRV